MRQDVYRTAYDEARAELNELMTEFDRLRVRKERLEKLRDSLKPIAEESESSNNGSGENAQAPSLQSFTY